LNQFREIKVGDKTFHARVWTRGDRRKLGKDMLDAQGKVTALQTELAHIKPEDPEFLNKQQKFLESQAELNDFLDRFVDENLQENLDSMDELEFQSIREPLLKAIAESNQPPKPPVPS